LWLSHKYPICIWEDIRESSDDWKQVLAPRDAINSNYFPQNTVRLFIVMEIQCVSFMVGNEFMNNTEMKFRRQRRDPLCTIIHRPRNVGCGPSLCLFATQLKLTSRGVVLSESVRRAEVLLLPADSSLHLLIYCSLFCGRP
jgi:hypothetical protein